MDWMYKGISGIADREEYLMGRKIDKTFEMMEREENPNAAKDEEESALINQIVQNNLMENFSKNDMTAKMREDPLFAIQMKQQEQRKEILHNPVKLKHLQEILKDSLKKDKKHKRKEKKKSKKKHKSKKCKKSSEHQRKSSSEESSQEDSDVETKVKHLQSPERKEKDSRSHRHHEHSQQRERSHSESLRASSQRRYQHKSHSSRRPLYERPEKAPIKPRLTEEEIERRRKEMMDNAAAREKERVDNVKRLNERESEEDRLQQGSTSTGAKFIKPMLASLANSSSIEDSIRQKKFTSQRGPGSMDRNFARRS